MSPCVRVCVFSPPRFSLFGRKASSRNASSRCTIVGLREAFGPLSKVMAELVSARSFLGSRLLCSGLYLQPQTAPRSTCSEDGERRGETPGPRAAFFQVLNFALPAYYDIAVVVVFSSLSGISSPSAAHRPEGGEMWVFFFFFLLVASETDTPPAHSMQPQPLLSRSSACTLFTQHSQSLTSLTPPFPDPQWDITYE